MPSIPMSIESNRFDDSTRIFLDTDNKLCSLDRWQSSNSCAATHSLAEISDRMNSIQKISISDAKSVVHSDNLLKLINRRINQHNQSLLRKTLKSLLIPLLIAKLIGSRYFEDIKSISENRPIAITMDNPKSKKTPGGIEKSNDMEKGERDLLVQVLKDKLQGGSKITDLKISTSLSKEILDELLPLLKAKGDLKKFKISCVPSDVLEDLCQHLSDFQNLRHLSFKGTYLHGRTEALVPLLKNSKSLEKLDLRKTELTNQNNFGHGDSKPIAEALKSNSTLKKLDLSSNRLGSQDAGYIANALKINTTLEQLNLSHNRIKSCDHGIFIDKTDLGGINALADALRSNTSLKSLNVRRNYLEDDGVKPFLDMFTEGTFGFFGKLHANRSLESINLSENKLTEDSAADLGGVFKTNQHLKKVNLSWNGFIKDDHFSPSLIDGLKANRSIQKLNIKDGSPSPKVKQALASVFSENNFPREVRFKSNYYDKSAQGIEGLGSSLLLGLPLFLLTSARRSERWDSLKKAKVMTHQNYKAIADLA